MRFFTNRLFRTLLLLHLIAVVSPAISQTKSAKTANGSVSGHVTVRAKSAAGMTVLLRASGFNQTPSPSYRATTDAEGNYRIADVPPGSYQIAPSAPSYVISGNQKVVIIGEGEAVEDFDFAVVRGGVVTGKVTNADGRPVIEERVYLVAADPAPQQGFMGNQQGAVTDDRGVYRIFGIKEGRYRVAVGKSERSFFESVANGRKLYQQTFHPDVSDPMKATIIEVGEGTEATNIDVLLGAPIQTYTAAGRAVSAENGQPVPNVRFGLRTIVDGSPRNGSFAGSNVVANSKGEFRLENLMPGKYATFLVPVTEDEVFAEAVSFEVLDQDVSGLLVKTHKGASITGVVTLEGTSNKELIARIPQLHLNAWVSGDEMTSPVARSSAIGPDGSFRMGGLQPGTAGFGFGYNQGPLSKGLVISRIERDGVLQPQGIAVKAGEQIGGVRIVVVYAGATVRGMIKVHNGTLPPETRFHVELNEKAGELPMMTHPIEVDARGRFLIESLPAGTHELMVIPFVPGAVPGARVPPRRIQQQINVTDGENDVTVVIDLKTEDPPRP